MAIVTSSSSASARLQPPRAHGLRLGRPRRLALSFLSLLALLAAAAASATPQQRDANANANANAGDDDFELLPERARLAERLQCGDTRLYRVRGLRVGAAYDVKLSYPASIPTDFTLEVRRVLSVDAPSAAAVAGPRRRVLNTAKLRLLPREILLRSVKADAELAREAFALDPSVLVDGGVSLDAVVALELAVRGQVEGVSRVLDLQSRECVFDIVVEELVLGGLVPRASLSLVAWLVVALALAARVVFPWLTAKIALERPEDVGDASADRKQS